MESPAEQRLAISIVALGLMGILLLWWQLHREARIADQIRASEEKIPGHHPGGTPSDRRHGRGRPHHLLE